MRWHLLFQFFRWEFLHFINWILQSVSDRAQIHIWPFHFFLYSVLFLLQDIGMGQIKILECPAFGLLAQWQTWHVCYLHHQEMLSECTWVYNTACRGNNVTKDRKFKRMFGLFENWKRLLDWTLHKRVLWTRMVPSLKNPTMYLRQQYSTTGNQICKT